MEIADFDNHAPDYDETFTNTITGKLYRNIVHAYLQKNVLAKQLNILEINCGTGEDALFLADLGHRVLATDVSPQMINQASRKANSRNLTNLNFVVKDINRLTEINQKFDLIFSNFGGLNCLNPQQLKQSLFSFRELLVTNGRLILVIMPKFCFWEMLYFFLKFKWRKIFRRAGAQPIAVEVGGVAINTWFYQPTQLINLADGFKHLETLPVGIVLPPPSFHSILSGHKFRTLFLFYWERVFSKISLLSSLSDHYLIDFRKV